MLDLMLTLRGAPLEAGRQHGRQVQGMRSLLDQAIRNRLHLLRRLDADNPQALRPALDALHSLDRPLLDFLVGLGESLELELDQLLRYTLSSYLLDLHKVRSHEPAVSSPVVADGCTTWAASGPATVGGAPILVKNRDYHQDHIPLQILNRVEPEEGYAYLCLGSAGSPHVFSSGINQQGLAIADTHVLSRDIGPGLPRFSLMREVLQRHATTASALDYLGSVPHMGAGTLILADRAGHLAVWESGHRHSGHVSAPAGPYLASTNHFVTPSLAPAWVEDEPPLLEGNSPGRRRRVLDSLGAGAGQVDLAWAKGLMAAHGTPQDALCRHVLVDPRHPPHPGLESSTISTAIFLPGGLPTDVTGAPALVVGDGSPCRAAWSAFSLGPIGRFRETPIAP